MAMENCFHSKLQLFTDDRNENIFKKSFKKNLFQYQAKKCEFQKDVLNYSTLTEYRDQTTEPTVK